MRIKRALALCAAAILLPAASDPPPALAPYFHQGRFDPRDFGWMRGRFPDAGPAEVQAYAAIEAWMSRCYEEGVARTREELASMGIKQADLSEIGPRDLQCGAVMMANSVQTRSAATWADFQRDLQEARPVASSFLLALRLAERGTSLRHGATLEEQLLVRVVGEQVLRKAANWGQGELADAPRLSSGARSVLDAYFMVAGFEHDRANTGWLKAQVDRGGWPTIAQAGTAGSNAAWVLVQHADADPAFQLRALRLMTPLVASGEVNKRNYAYLYDRIMLKISGKQRYATQVTCKDGRRVAQPLEDEARVPALRAEMGLEPFADYLKQFANWDDC